MYKIVDGEVMMLPISGKKLLTQCRRDYLIAIKESLEYILEEQDDK